MIRNLTTEQIWQEWKELRKNLNESVKLNDYLEVNEEYELEDYFAKSDVNKMLILLDNMKDRVTSIRKSLQ